MNSSPARVVVVDANTIVHGAWRLESSAWRVLLHQARTRQVVLIVPDLVVREVVGRLRCELHARVAALASAANKLGDLTAVTATVVPVDEDTLVARYEEELRAILAEVGAEVVDLPDVDMRVLTQDAIDRRRPFNEKGSGFRDALLWRVVCQVAKERSPCSLALVSNDAAAFAVSKASRLDLHPHLTADLANIDFSGEVTLFESVANYLDSTGVGDPHQAALILEAAQAQEGSFAATVTSCMTSGDLLTPWPGVSVRVGAVEDVRVQLLRTVGGGEGLLLSHFLITATLRLQVACGGPAAFNDEVVAPLAVTGTATFDTANHQFGDLQFEPPPASDIPEVVEVVARAGSSLEALNTWPLELFEHLRRASEVKLPPDLLEQLRRATEVKLPPSYLEQFRRAAEVKLPPNFMEQLRRATEVKLPPDLLEQLRRASEVKLPRWLLDLMQEGEAPPASGIATDRPEPVDSEVDGPGPAASDLSEGEDGEDKEDRD